VGVGFVSQLPGTDRLMAAALDEGVGVVAHSFADPGPFVGPAHDRGATVLCQVRTVAEARRAADAGVDVVVAQGSDAGGHTGRVPTLALLPAVVDAVAPLPVVAAGGIGDGRAIVGALVGGAEGVWIGTRFLATHEAGVGEDHKRAVLRAGADDTLLTEVYDVVARTDWPDDVAGRVVRDEFVDRWHDRVDELRRLVDRGTPPDAPARQGWWAGPAAAFVTRRERAGDVVARLATDAAAVQRARDITR
jgi:nitronate monooxygenase